MVYKLKIYNIVLTLRPPGGLGGPTAGLIIEELIIFYNCFNNYAIISEFNLINTKFVIKKSFSNILPLRREGAPDRIFKEISRKLSLSAPRGALGGPRRG